MSTVMSACRSTLRCPLVTCCIVFLIISAVTNHARHFTIPHVCQKLNPAGFRTSNVTWNCYVNADDHGEDKLSCWFDLEGMFRRKLQLSDHTYTILHQHGVYYRSFNKTQNGGCMTLDVPCEPGETVVNISTVFPAGSEHYFRLVSFSTEDYERPYRIEKINTTEITNTSISLHWELPISRKPREVRIQYRSEYSLADWKERTILLEYNMFNKLFTNDLSCSDCNTNFINLAPFTVYNFKVDNIYVHDGERIGFWSDQVAFDVKTEAGVPTAVPTLLPGYFSAVNGSHLMVYWNPIPPSSRGGKIVDYRIRVTESRNRRYFQEIFLAPDNFFAVIMERKDSDLSISLTQRTDIGFPRTGDAKIVILSKTTRPLLPKNVLVEASTQTNVTFSWDVQYDYREHLSYTAYWCSSTTFRSCSKPFRTASLQQPYSVTGRSIATVYVEENYASFLFGISLETKVEDNVTFSSGIKWFQDCIYDLNGDPQIQPQLEIESTGYDQVFLRWKPLTCQDSGGVIDAYLIKYCTMIDTVCKDIIIKNVSSKEQTYLLKGLREGFNYSIQLGSQHRYRDSRGLWSDPVFYIVPQGKHSNAPQTTYIIMTVTCLLAAGSIAIVCYVMRKRVKKICKDPNITLPNILVTKIPLVQPPEKVDYQVDPQLDEGVGPSCPETSDISVENIDTFYKAEVIDSVYSSGNISRDGYSEVEQVDSDSMTESDEFLKQGTSSVESNEAEELLLQENIGCGIHNSNSTSDSSAPNRSDSSGHSSIISYCKATEKL